jgi:hypothetical protein
VKLGIRKGGGRGLSKCKRNGKRQKVKDKREKVEKVKDKGKSKRKGKRERVIRGEQTSK